MILIRLLALTKEGRTKFHLNIRKIFPTVDSKTEMNKEIENTYILIYPKGAKSLVNPTDNVYSDNMGDSRGGRGGGGGSDRDRDRDRGGRKEIVVQRWDRSKADYLHFTVIKCMLSTSEMMDKLAKMTSMLPTRFEFCGSKDKR